MDEWDRVLAVNVRGPYLCARAVLPSMLRRGGGQVITIVSVAALVPFPGRAAYSTSKGAALQLARSIARDYGADGIAVVFVGEPVLAWYRGLLAL